MPESTPESEARRVFERSLLSLRQELKRVMEGLFREGEYPVTECPGSMFSIAAFRALPLEAPERTLQKIVRANPWMRHTERWVPEDLSRGKVSPPARLILGALVAEAHALWEQVLEEPMAVVVTVDEGSVSLKKIGWASLLPYRLCQLENPERPDWSP